MKNALKRTLSLMLTVVMLVSCWVFVAPKADAATAGSYSVRVNYTVNNATDTAHMEENYIELTHKSNNKTGGESTYKWDLNSSNRITSTGSKNLTVSGVGFPSKIKMLLNQKGTGTAATDHDTLNVKITSVQVYNNNTSSYANVWTGSIELESEVFEKTGDASIDTSPSASSITAISGDATVAVSTSNDTVTKSYSLGTVKDNYGVNWYQDASWDTATTQNGVSFSSGTLTVPSSSNRSSNYTVTLKEKCGSSVSNSKTVTISTFDYKVTFYDENGTTVLKAEQTVDYGASATPPANPTKAYDSSKHYAFNIWTGDGYTTIKTGSQTKTVKASYTGTAHTPSNTRKYLKTEATCTADAIYNQQCSGCDYKYTSTWTDTGTALGHDWKTPTFTFSNDGTTATATRVCDRNSSHTETADATVDGGVEKTPATCTVKGWTTYTATSPWSDGATDHKDVQDINALGHSWGAWTFNFNSANVNNTTYTPDDSHKRVCSRDASHVDYAAHDHSTWLYDTDDAPQGASINNNFNNENQHYSVCPSCSHVAYENHDYQLTAHQDSTCTANGYNTYLCKCGKSYTDQLPMLEHTYPNGGAYTTVVEPTCTENGSKQRTCSVCGTIDTQPINSPGHDRYEIYNSPTNGSSGSVCYGCHNCSKYWTATYDSSTETYTPATEYNTLALAKRNTPASAKVAAPKFNDFTNEAINYNYAMRGASLKIADLDFVDYNTKQGLRFTASLHVPDGVTYSDDNNIVDFGFIYSQTNCEYVNNNINNLTLETVRSDRKIAKMSVAANNSDKGPFDGSNWTGVSAHDDEVYGGKTLTFNLLVNVKAYNWTSDYCARAYVVYNYHGHQYTVYDNQFSSRSVEYIARAAAANPDETQKVIDMCNNKIITPINEGRTVKPS